MKKLFLPLALIFFIACDKKDDNSSPSSIEGLKPIYTDVGNEQVISDQAPISITKGYKIHVKSNYVFIVEKGLGVHVIDNTVPSNPSNMRFLKIPGITDAAVRNTTLYANNLNDIVAVDISNLESVSVSSRLADLFNIGDFNFPPGYSGYFECVEEGKGMVSDWEVAILNNPKCMR